MDYFVNINGTTHKLVQGFTVSEEYNETLDSANIIISDSPQLNIKPYDDVFIYSEYCGYYDAESNRIMPNYNQKFVFKGYPVDSRNYKEIEMPYYYRHFLLDQYTEELLILGSSNLTSRYQYKIDLFSETKGLETIQAPNVSITQPLTTNKTSIIEYTNNFLELYNKKIKVSQVDNIDGWVYAHKYNIAKSSNERSMVVVKKYNASSVASIFNYDIIGVKNLNGSISDSIKIPKEDYFKNNIIEFEGFEYYKRSRLLFPMKINGSYEDIISMNTIKMPSLLDYVDNVFKESYSPDFTLNSPSLRQIIEKLFITKDCIPVVLDSEIYALDITKRRGEFDLKRGQINYITGSLSSDNYCTDLKRTYSEALTQENSGRYVEYLGFRNSNSALMTLENMRIETKFPIYKINKIYMCYFKKVIFYENDKEPTENYFLCKQDITPLVKLNSERNILSEDIEDFNLDINSPIEEISKFKLATVGYDIGSNYIEGWGTKYSYPHQNFWWQGETTVAYIENMFNYMNRKYPYGIYDYDFIIKNILGDSFDPDGNYATSTYFSVNDSIKIPKYEDNDDWYSILDLINQTADRANEILHYKHLFFELDYQAFYSGSVVHSKGLGSENITINDNQSSSLALLELDGLAQKEKLNRYGNKGLQINARYTNLNDIQGLGSVYEHDNDNDIIIFHKQYSVNANVVNCTYYGSKNYVLKNYFTSVYARHRTYNLMGYGESITRAENEKMYVVLSKSKKYTDKDSNIKFEHFDNESFIRLFFSFFKGVESMKAYNDFDYSKKINYGFFYNGKSNNENGRRFGSDVNIFVNGLSLCLNIAMHDNIVAGTYISNMRNNYAFYDSGDYLVGATQKWAMMVDDVTTGRIESLNVSFGHVDDFLRGDEIYSKNFDVDSKYEKINKLPVLADNITLKNTIRLQKKFYKDNKEKIDMTVQIEPIADNDVFISPWVSKLSDLFSVYHKFNKSLTYEWDNQGEEAFENSLYNTCSINTGGRTGGRPPILIMVIEHEKGEDWIENYKKIKTIDGSFIFDKKSPNAAYQFSNVQIQCKRIFPVSSDSLKIIADIPYTIGEKGSSNTGYRDSCFYNEPLVFNKTVIEQYTPMQGYNNVYEYLKERVLKHIGKTDDNCTVLMCVLNDFHRALNNGESTSNVPLNAFHGIEWGCYSGEGKSYSSEPGTTDDLISQGLLKGIKKLPGTVTYEQNLFYVYTDKTYNFREYMVYDELSSLGAFHTLVYNDEINFEWNNDDLTINVSKQIPTDGYLFCYYKTENNMYNFVFGVRIDEKNNVEEGKTKINLYLSPIQFRDTSIYDKNTNLKIGDVHNELD